MEKSAIINALDCICYRATRDLLESDASWYFRYLGKPGGEARVDRTLLEQIAFIHCMFDVSDVGIYQLSIDGIPYRHNYYSGGEVLRYILEHCSIELTPRLPELRTNHRGSHLITIEHIRLSCISPQKAANTLPKVINAEIEGGI